LDQIQTQMHVQIQIQTQIHTLTQTQPTWSGFGPGFGPRVGPHPGVGTCMGCMPTPNGQLCPKQQAKPLASVIQTNTNQIGQIVNVVDLGLDFA
jgi:hypothetical protein